MRAVLGLFALLCTSQAIARKVNYKDCGSMAGSVRSVTVSPCPAEPCALRLNTNVNFTIEFDSKVSSRKVLAVVYGVVSGVPLPMPLADPDACHHGIKCPIRPGQQNTYFEQVFIDPSFPTIDVIVQWELQDDNAEDLVCVQIPAHLTM